MQKKTAAPSGNTAVFRFVASEGAEYKIQEEEKGDDVHRRGYFLFLAGDELYDRVGDETERDSVGDTEGERHYGQHEVGRKSFREIIKWNLFQALDHEAANNDEYRGNCLVRNDFEKRHQE